MNSNSLQWSQPDFLSHNSPFPFTVPPAGSSIQNFPFMIPSITPSYEAILKLALPCVLPSLAIWIAEFLEWHYPSISEDITSLRARLVPLLTDPNVVFCVMEWKEGYDTEVLAFFHPFGKNGAYSCLLHSGGGPWQVDKNRWTNSSLSWYITDISHLKYLFLVAPTMSLHFGSQSSSLQRYLQASNDQPSPEGCVSFQVQFMLMINIDWHKKLEISSLMLSRLIISELSLTKYLNNWKESVLRKVRSGSYVAYD